MLQFDERGYLKPYAVTELELADFEAFFVTAHFSYFCKWNHRFYEQAKEDENEFRLLLGFSREDENQKRWPKGIIKINFLP